MTDLRTAAAKLSKAVLDKASWLETMQLAGEVINALAQSDAGPFGAGRPVFLTEATPAPTAAIEGASDGPALKCPNPDCRDGLIQVILYDGTPDVETCEDCHGTGEMP